MLDVVQNERASSNAVTQRLRHDVDMLRHDLETLKGHLQTNNIVTSQLDADLADKWLPQLDEIAEKTEQLAAAEQRRRASAASLPSASALSGSTTALTAKEAFMTLLQVESPIAKLHRIGQFLSSLEIRQSSSADAQREATHRFEGAGE